MRRGPDAALRGLADRFGGLDVTSEGRGVVVAVVAQRGTAAASVLRNGDGNCSTSLGRNLSFTTPCAAAGMSSATHTYTCALTHMLANRHVLTLRDT